MRKIALLLFASVALLFFATLSPRAQQQPEIKKAPVPYSQPESGAAMYKDYCAVCHGLAGKGDGPAASALKTPVPDLTALTKNNNGEFPAMRVSYTLTYGGTNSGAHGSENMPVWGHLFKNVKKDLVNLRVANITDYLKSIQQK